MKLIITITQEIEGTVDDCFDQYKQYIETLHPDAHMSVTHENPIPEDREEFERLCYERYQYGLWSEPNEEVYKPFESSKEKFNKYLKDNNLSEVKFMKILTCVDHKDVKE